MHIEEGLLYIMDNYLREKSNEFASNKLANFLRQDIVDIIRNSHDDLQSDTYKITGSPGKGKWAEIPWIGIFKKDITLTAQKGIYIVFLFSSDMDRVYLSFNQGVTYFKENKISDRLEIASETIRDLIPREYLGANMLKEIDLECQGNLGKGYEEGNIYSRVYKREDLRGQVNIRRDLGNFMDMYRHIDQVRKNKTMNEFYQDLIAGNQGQIIREDNRDSDYSDIAPRELLKHIYAYIESRGYVYSYEDLGNLYLALKTKPFVLLAGISGTGKTKIVELFAQALGANPSNGRYRLIPVKPDWNDSVDLLGYTNINGDFIPGLLTEIVYEANKKENLDKPYFICLDEMNLARVEYYLSEYLSLIETREEIDGRVRTKSIYEEASLKDSPYRDIYFSDNIFLLGTVNMDDTTFAFSKKVLDRANTIEYSQVNLDLDLIREDLALVQPWDIDNENLKTNFLSIKDALLVDREYVEGINKEIIEINSRLEKYKEHFGYRLRDEIVFYMLENKRLDILAEDQALDYMILQKILPRINGSDNSIKMALVDLYNYFNPENQLGQSSNYLDRVDLSKSKYYKSSSKIIDMLRGYENGYVSFW